MANVYPNVIPGEIVPSGLMYPFNAQATGDDLYLRDGNGNIIPGRIIYNGESFLVLDVSYSKQLLLVQYSTSAGIRQGYITNAANIIKYFSQDQWKNGSTSELVYDQNDVVIGSLDPGELATPLYKAGGKTHVVYSTSKGTNTKSGYVAFEGLSGGLFNEVAPGEVVTSGFSYSNNATVIGDDLYLRDSNGNIITGRQVDNGDRITVLDVGYTKQLALVQYQAGSVVRQGYITNLPSIIKYDSEFNWCNGSTIEYVYDDKGIKLGLLSPYEAATILYKKGNQTHVVYDTDKGHNTKSGFVNFTGIADPPDVTIPSLSEPNVYKSIYGYSGRNRPLEVYSIGSGDKILFAGFGIHGFEDNWERDGVALATIATELIKELAAIDRDQGLNGWTVYVAPCMNPDGLLDGKTNNGPGRCAPSTLIDLNRSFPVGFSVIKDSRNFTGSEPLLAPEAKALEVFIRNLKSQTSRMVLLDCHGWLNQTLGNPTIGYFFEKQFGFGHNDNFGGGYFSTWANSIGIDSILLEYPPVYCTQEAIDKGFVTKTLNGIKEILDFNLNDGDADNTIETAFVNSGQVINVTSFLNVRSNASISASIIGSLNNEECVNITAIKGDWYKIYYGQGFGYVHKAYIKLFESILSPIDKVLIFQTQRGKLTDKNGEPADDLKTNDFSNDDLLNINLLFTNELLLADKPDILFEIFKAMVTDFFSTEEMESVILDMIEHFKSGAGTDYSNSVLTLRAMEHENTKKYIDSTKSALIEELIMNGGNLSALEYKENGVETNLHKRIMLTERPIFNTITDIYQGLTITIDDTWANNIEVRNYSLVDKNFEGTIHFTIYDHFGLDKPDVEKEYVFLGGFRSWFLLQHYNQFNSIYKPFVTVIEIDVPFEGFLD